MKIDKICIATYPGDAPFRRACVASIRFYYPDIPIYLVKDELHGPFDTSDLESEFAVQRYPTPLTRFGWAMGKLEPLFEKTRSRFLVLDSDIVFVGPVLSRLEAIDADFVVSGEPGVHTQMKKIYFDLSKVKKFDPDYVFPGFTFNAGQWVGTSGIFSRDDLARFVDWNVSPPQGKLPKLFPLADQGVLNFLLARESQKGRIRLAETPFMIWGGSKEIEKLTLDGIRRGEYPSLVHWAGIKMPTGLRKLYRRFPRKDILDHFASYHRA